MRGIDLDPQTTSDYWAHYLRVMKQAKTPLSADHLRKCVTYLA